MPVPETASFPHPALHLAEPLDFFTHHLLLLFQQYSKFFRTSLFQIISNLCQRHAQLPQHSDHIKRFNLIHRIIPVAVCPSSFLVRTAQSHHNGRAFPLSCLPALQIAPRLNTPVFPFLTPFPEYVLSEFFLFFTFFALDYRVTLSFIIANDSNFHKKSFPSKACLKKAFHT